MVDVFYKYFVAHCPLPGVHFICVTFLKQDPLPPSGAGRGGDPTHMGVLQRESPGIRTSCWKTEGNTNIMDITKMDYEDGIWTKQSRIVSSDKSFINLFVVYLCRFQ